MRAAKRLYEATWPNPGQAGLELESALQFDLIGPPNQMAAVIAGMSKQPAEFTDPEPGGRAASH